MKTSLLLALLAASALSAGALAQSTSTGTATDTGSSATTTPPAPAAAGTSPSTGANTGSGSTSGTGTGSASSTPGDQSPNPTILGHSTEGPRRNQGDWGGGPGTGYGGQPMMQGMMTCVSPAPMGGFGSFACYPAGWGGGMAMNGMMGGMRDGLGMDMMGWHHMWHGQGADSERNENHKTERGKRDRSRVPGSDDGNSSGPYDEDDDNDWRSNTGGTDGSGQDDYSNP